ncbi:MAG TPA: SUF system NifU family Fe-S cluster assembly protein, partial [Verrucomicrobiae bacterium]|nr:SUF system NifU family Fe-S cluster assembly protein [Verrucomicrobiae bacterium]
EDLRDLYNDLILDHEKRPRNFHVLQNATQSAQGDNPMCGDKVTIYLHLENDVIKDASFTGKSCAICTASASLLTENIKGKTRSQAEAMFGRVRELMMTGKVNGDLGKLIAFSTVHEHLVKIKCAILPWHALNAALKGESKPVSTENGQT